MTQSSNSNLSFDIHTIQLWGYPATDDNYAYFIVDKGTNGVYAVDPSVFSPPVINKWNELISQNNKLKMLGVLCTHKHYDHTNGNNDMKNKFKCKIYGGVDDNNKSYLGNNAFTDTLKEGDTLSFGSTVIDIYDVPCHTKGHVLYHVYDANDKMKENGALFTGDTLFVGGVGHFREGNGDDMYNNFEKIRKFHKNTKIYPGHEYALSNYQFGLYIEPENKNLIERIKFCKLRKNKICIPSTVDIECKSNVFMRCKENQSIVSSKYQEALKYVRSGLDKYQKFKSLGDVMYALRMLKTSGYHKKHKPTQNTFSKI